MISDSRRLRSTTLLLAAAVLLAACTDSESEPTPAPGPGVTTLPPVATPAPAPPTTTTTTTTTRPPDEPPPTPQELLVDRVEELIAEAEELRGLGFLSLPPIVLLDPTELAARVDRGLAARADEVRLAAETALFRLIGRLDADDDLGSLHTSLRGLPDSAWYDPVAGALLVAFRPGELGPLARSEVIHEVVHALTDQHYRWPETRGDLAAGGADDRLAALDALVEGDATYIQLLYIQSLSPAEKDEIAAAFLEPSEASAGAPDWVIEDLAFSFDSGFDFVADLVENGGNAAVDRAYLDPPASTEHILHPERYRRGELPYSLEPLLLTVDGYTGLEEAMLGEWGLRLILAETALPGLLTQRVDGWGGDRYQIFVDGTGGVAFSYAYVGDSEAHAIEVTEGFLDLAENVLDLGEGVRTGGGVVYRRNNRPWMFIDREVAGLVVVIASDRGVGEDLMGLLSPPS